MKKSVIFDMDGVIIDSEPLHHQVFKIYSKELGINVNDDEYNTFIGRSNEEVYAYLKEKYNLKGEVNILVCDYVTKCRDYIKSQKGIMPISGVAELIKSLKVEGVQLALASSSERESIKNILDMFELSEYFDIKVSAQDVKNAKPAPDIFLYTAELLGVKPENCVVIEDSKNGVAAAKAAGMTCIGYKNPNSGNQDLSKADVIIDSFIDFSMKEYL